MQLAAGARMGQYVLLIDTDGLRHAVRLGCILAASDVDDTQGMTILQLPGGRSILLHASLDQVVAWLSIS